MQQLRLRLQQLLRRRWPQQPPLSPSLPLPLLLLRPPPSLRLLLARAHLPQQQAPCNLRAWCDALPALFACCLHACVCWGGCTPNVHAALRVCARALGAQLCRRGFKDAATLKAHEERSPLHLENVRKQQEEDAAKAVASVADADVAAPVVRACACAPLR